MVMFKHFPAHMQHTKILLYVPINSELRSNAFIIYFYLFYFWFVAELWFNECPVWLLSVTAADLKHFAVKYFINVYISLGTKHKKPSNITSVHIYQQ